MSMQIDILIPTYNRADDLITNLNLIQKSLSVDSLYSMVKVIISDNCSPDNTQEAVRDFISNKNDAFTIEYYRTEENIGLERNAVHVLSKANSPFVIFLGDDDFLAESYIKYCLDKINENSTLGCIIPGILALYKDGSKKDVRGNAEEKMLQPGFNAVLDCSHWGHQMSGILCKREGLLESYLSQEQHRTPYLFLYFTAYCLHHHVGIYNPTFKTTVNNFNEKDWGYNKVGLLDEVFKCYYYFENLYASKQISDLLIRFTRLHSYRLAFSTKNFKKIYRQYKILLQSTPSFDTFQKELRMLFIKDSLIAFFK